MFSIRAHRRVRECKAKFLMTYERHFALGWNPNLARVRRKEKQLSEEMLTQINQHPELLEAFTEMANAKQDYDSARAKSR